MDCESSPDAVTGAQNTSRRHLAVWRSVTYQSSWIPPWWGQEPHQTIGAQTAPPGNFQAAEDPASHSILPLLANLVVVTKQKAAQCGFRTLRCSPWFFFFCRKVSTACDAQEEKLPQLRVRGKVLPATLVPKSRVCGGLTQWGAQSPHFHVTHTGTRKNT